MDELTLEIKAAAQKMEAATVALKEQEQKNADLQKDVADLKGAFVKKEEADRFIESQLNQINLVLKNQRQQEVKETFEGALEKAIAAKAEDLKNFDAHRRQGVNIEVKAVGDIGAANFTQSGTNSFAGADVLPVIGRKPYEVSHVRNLLTATAISSDQLAVIRDAGGEGAPTLVLPGADKPQSDRDYVKHFVPVSKIAHHYRIPEEYINDLAWLQNEIQQVGIEELLQFEDDRVLNAVGTTTQFAGLTQAFNSTPFAAPASLALQIDNANNYDVLIAAQTQLRNLKVGAGNFILVNPSDYAVMLLTKATDGQYVFGAPNMTIPNVMGVPIVPHTAIASDKFLIGDRSKVYFGTRAGLTVRLFDQDRDNAIKNMITIVIEERITVASVRPDYMIFGDFSDARAALELP